MYFFGLPIWAKGLRVYDLERKRTFTSRGVTFYEDIFPFGESPQSVADQTKGDNPRRLIDGLLSNNLGPAVHIFA